MEAKKFFDELQERIRKTRSSEQMHIFAQRAADVITTAYDLWQQSPNFGNTRPNATAEQVAAADQLIEMGVVEAILGRGRRYLRR